MSNRNGATVGAMMLVAGGIIGAGVALLFAPQSGKRTRKDISRYAKKTRDKASDMVDDLTDSVSDLVDSVTEKTGDLIDQGRHLAKDAKKEMLSSIEHGLDKLEKQRNKLVKMVG